MSSIETRSLEARGGRVAFTALGFGGVPLGNLYRAMSDETAAETLRAALDVGIRYFDTAPLYGLGLSEERFGATLPGHDGLTYSTKIGRVTRDPHPGEAIPSGLFMEPPNRSFDFDYSYDGVMRAHEQSLARMKVDAVDVLLVHDVDVWTHGSKEESDRRLREVMEGGYRAMDELRSSGAVKAIGAGVNEWEICDWLMRRGEFDCFLLAGRYTLLEQSAQESFLPECVERRIGIILGGPYNSGILATGPVEGAYYNYAPAGPDVLERVRRIQTICEAHGSKLVEAAMHFVLAHPAIVSVIPGAASPDEVRRNAQTLAAAPDPALWAELRAEGLIREDAPVPG